MPASLVAREKLIAKLREIGYRFKRQAWRVQMWKRGTHYVAVPQRDLFDADVVRSILRQCGCVQEETERFLAQACN